MFETHFGLRENPFLAGHQSRYVYPSREHQEALAHLRFGVENFEPFVLITGEVGTGKTTALFEALADLPTRAAVALITNSALTRSELIEEICLKFGFALTPPVSKPQALAALERHLLALRARGERAILLLDEAQNLDRDLLEEIRLLSNLEANGQKLLQVFLIGQPELEAKLSRPELRQLRQRIAVHYRLRPLSAEDTEHYIHHRVSVAGGNAPEVFPREACLEVHAMTNGIPREINQICSQAMLNAFVEDSYSVRAAHVRAAAEETRFQSVLPVSEMDPRIPPPPTSWRTPEPGTFAPGDAAAAPPAPPAPALPAVPIRERPAQSAPEPTPIARAEPAAPAPAEPVVPAPVAPPSTSAAATSAWENWVASLAQQAGGAGSPPAAETAWPARTAPPTQEQAPRPEPPPAGEVPSSPAGAAPPPTPARDPATTSQPRYAAESAALSDAATGSRLRAEEWRPPRWTPEGGAGRPGRGAAPATYPGSRYAPAEEPSGRGMRWLIGAASLAVIVVATVLLARFAPWARPPAAQSPEQLPSETALPESSQASMPVPGRTPGTAAPTTAAPSVPEPTPVAPAVTAPAAPTETVAERPAVPPTTATTVPAGQAIAAQPATRSEFSITVGAYMRQDRADSERVRLEGSTGLRGRIAPVHQEGTTMYAVVLGAFKSRDEADRVASDLIVKGLVDETRIISRTVPAKR